MAFEKCKHELIFEVLWYIILIITWIKPMFSFTELVTCNPMQICSWIFPKHFEKNFLSDNCERLLPYINFHILRNSHLEKGVLKSFTKFTGKHQRQSLILIKLQAYCYIKKRLWQRCFPMNFCETFENTSSGYFCILKISVPVVEFTSAVD